MARVPVLIVTCYETVEDVQDELLLASAWAAVENILLAAAAEDLGSCICTTLNDEEETKLKEVLEMPPAYRIATIIQIGYADGAVATPQRKKLEEIVSYQRF
jgi:nitroreductase